MLDIALSFTDLNPLEAEYVRESLEAERADALARQAVQVRELEATRQLAEESRNRVVLEARRYGEVRRRNRALIGAVGLLVLLLAGAIALALYGYRQSRLALARQLAVESISTPNLDLSLLLAAQARQVTGEAEEANSAVFRGVMSAAPELSAILHGHAGDVWSVAFDPKNPDRFATGGEDRTVLLWSAAARRTITGMEPLKLERASVYALGFSPDGQRLAVGTGDGALTVFDVSGPAPVARGIITAHQGALFSLAFDPANPDLLLTGGQDRAVRLWDLRGDTPVLAGPVAQGQPSNVMVGCLASARTPTSRPAAASGDGHQHRLRPKWQKRGDGRHARPGRQLGPGHDDADPDSGRRRRVRFCVGIELQRGQRAACRGRWRRRNPDMGCPRPGPVHPHTRPSGRPSRGRVAPGLQPGSRQQNAGLGQL
jgi:hypothetical protein